MPAAIRRIPLQITVEGYRLSGCLHLPPGGPHPVVVGSHGLFSDGSSPKQIELAERCNRHGIAYFRFDHRGCGGSTGDFETATTLEGRCRDLEAVARHLAAEPDLDGRIGLFGSSLGGAACLAAASRIGPERIVTVAAPIDSRSILAAEGLAASGIPDAFRRGSLQFDLRPVLSSVKGLLVIHGDRDETVPVHHGRELYARVGEPKRLVLNAEGDHRMSRRDHQVRFLEEAIAWYAPLTAPRNGDSGN